MKGDGTLIRSKIASASFNVIASGSGVIVRSAVQLLKANLITRIISAVLLLLLDITDLYRNRISIPQFIRNALFSVLLVVVGAIGWEWGSAWIALEFLGNAVEVLGGIIGSGLAIGVVNKPFEKVCEKAVKSDSYQMMEIINPLLANLHSDDRKEILKRITPSVLKAMYASDDRKEFVVNLVRQEWMEIS